MAVALAALVSATACTDEASPPVSTAELTTTIVVQESTTTEASTTTTAPEPTAPPTSSQEEIEAELIATLDGADSIFYLDPIDPDSPILDRYYVPQMAADLRLALSARLEAGHRYEGVFERRNIIDIVIEGRSATVVECGLDAIAAIGADGTVVVESDEVPYIRAYELVLGDDGLWRVGDISFGSEKQQCE